MPNCENITGCPFFNGKMDNMPAASGLYKVRYCEGDKTKCARYMVCTQVGKEKMPKDLFPNEKERAEEIIKKG